MAGVDGSPYFTLSEFVEHGRQNEPGARFVLMITNGIDPYNGTAVGAEPGQRVRADRAGRYAAGGMTMYSIYYPQSFPRQALVESFSGQGYLAQVGEATGH